MKKSRKEGTEKSKKKKKKIIGWLKKKNSWKVIKKPTKIVPIHYKIKKNPTKMDFNH